MCLYIYTCLYIRAVPKCFRGTGTTKQHKTSDGEEDRVDAEEVTFEQFAKWWHRKADDERKTARTKARELFDSIDSDGDGTVNKQELAQMAKMLQKHFPRIKFNPVFDLVEDFKAMDVDGLGEITFERFESWWKRRTVSPAPATNAQLVPCVLTVVFLLLCDTRATML